jgi:hypothetical protein
MTVMEATCPVCKEQKMDDAPADVRDPRATDHLVCHGCGWHFIKYDKLQEDSE